MTVSVYTVRIHRLFLVFSNVFREKDEREGVNFRRGRWVDRPECGSMRSRKREEEDGVG